MPARTPKTAETEHAQVTPAIISKRVEEKQVQERAAIGAYVAHENIRHEGEQELGRASSALACSGVAAGLSMGFSLVPAGLLDAYLPGASWRPRVSKLGYSVGLLIVVLGRQHPHAETTLTAVPPFVPAQH